MVLDFCVGEEAFVCQDVIDEDVVARRFVVRIGLVVIVILQNLASLVDDSLVEFLQIFALLFVLSVALCQLERKNQCGDLSLRVVLFLP